MARHKRDEWMTDAARSSSRVKDAERWDLTHREFRACILIGSNANYHHLGNCWMSHPTLADNLGLTGKNRVQTARDTVKELARKGWLHIDVPGGRTEQGSRANRYILRWPDEHPNAAAYNPGGIVTSRNGEFPPEHIPPRGSRKRDLLPRPTPPSTSKVRQGTAQRAGSSPARSAPPGGVAGSLDDTAGSKTGFDILLPLAGIDELLTEAKAAGTHNTPETYHAAAERLWRSTFDALAGDEGGGASAAAALTSELERRGCVERDYKTARLVFVKPLWGQGHLTDDLIDTLRGAVIWMKGFALPEWAKDVTQNVGEDAPEWMRKHRHWYVLDDDA